MKKLSVLFIMLCCACTKEEPMTISDAGIKLKYDSKHQFTLQRGTETVSNSEIEWKTSDDKVGTINNTGYFKGRKIGKTEVIAYTNKGTAKTEIEITPYSTLYTEPVLDFAQTKQAIKAKEKRKLMLEDTDILAFEGENSKVELMLYVFENNRLSICGPVFSTSSSIVNEVGTFLIERYP